MSSPADSIAAALRDVHQSLLVVEESHALILVRQSRSGHQLAELQRGLSELHSKLDQALGAVESTNRLVREYHGHNREQHASFEVRLRALEPGPNAVVPQGPER